MTDEYLKDLYDKLTAKLTAECRRIGSIIPYISVNGRYKDLDIEHDGICWWTNGFWPGILWQMYNATKDESFRETAVKVENRLDNAFEVFTGLHHDVGFMWLHSSVANHRLTRCSDANRRSLHAAGLLAGRYNPDARYIRAWNGNNVGYTIVDTMMNLPLLYWAGQELGDPRFKQIATHHADTCMRVTVRSDGSTNHIVNLDPNTGDVLSVPEGQGYAPDSTWSRGNAWALYGFALSYRHSGQKKYLDTAKKIAHYFTVNLAINDWLPLVDFRAPKNPVYYDSTAAMIAVCGLLEIAEHVSDTEKDLYIASATKTLSACENKFCDWNPETDGILGGGTVAYHSKDSNNVPIIYGDYFLTEAILRLCGKHFHIW